MALYLLIRWLSFLQKLFVILNVLFYFLLWWVAVIKWEIGKLLIQLEQKLELERRFYKNALRKINQDLCTTFSFIRVDIIMFIWLYSKACVNVLDFLNCVNNTSYQGWWCRRKQNITSDKQLLDELKIHIHLSTLSTL